MPRKTGKAAASHLQLVGTLSEWQSRHVLARDGLKLHLREIGNRAGQDVPVICLPGLSRNADDFEVIGRSLAETGDRWVLALDSRGRGGSEYDPDWRRYDLQVELDDLFTVLDALAVPRAIFFGTSRGGLLTAMTSIARPSLLAAAILNDIGPVIEGRGLARIRGYVGKLPQPKTYADAEHILRQVFGTHFTDMPPDAWNRFARRTWAEGPKGLVPRYDPNLMRPLAELDLEKPLPVLWPQFEPLAAVPMMVIRGELSDILSAETARAMVERHPNARLHEVVYQGHAPILEDAPTIEAVRAFVETIR